MPVTPVTDFGQAFLASLTGALAIFLGAIPRVIGFVLWVVIGWVIASIVAGLVVRLLRAIRFNDLARRAGLSDFVHKMGVQMDPAGVIADLAKWAIRLVFLGIAFDALGLPGVSAVFGQILGFLPNLVVAIVALVIGGLLAGALASLVRGATAEAGLGNPDLLAGIARAAVWAFAIVVAVNQVGIATTLVNTLFTAVVGALALALGLAFGLGGRDTAARIVQGWYERGQQAAPRIAQAASAAADQARQQTQSLDRDPMQRSPDDRSSPAPATTVVAPERSTPRRA